MLKLADQVKISDQIIEWLTNFQKKWEQSITNHGGSIKAQSSLVRDLFNDDHTKIMTSMSVDTADDHGQASTLTIKIGTTFGRVGYNPRVTVDPNVPYQKQRVISEFEQLAEKIRTFVKSQYDK